MAQALRKAGNRVTIATLDKTNLERIYAKYGLACEPDCEVFLVPHVFETDSLMSRGLLALAFLFAESVLLRLKKYDLIINTSGELVNFVEDIAYINAVPLRAAFDYPESLPIQNSWWRCCSKVYDLWLKAVADRLNKNSLLLTNSKFTANIIERKFDRRALVVHPPVDSEEFSSLSEKKRHDNLVLSASRFRAGKTLEHVPKVAKHVKNSKFLIVGPSDKASETTISAIQVLAERLGVHDRVQLLTNEPISFLRKAMSEAKVFLHTQSFEAFGMAVVEAMAAGCVPVVPRNGGPWFDVLDEKQGRYGYSYRSVGEAADIIMMLLEDEELRRQVSARARKRAMAFDRTIFEKKILDVINKVYAAKSG
ncbi:MAG: glycosyltransferase family 4 protein [Candidatus Bathyarchaeia archaeon]